MDLNNLNKACKVVNKITWIVSDLNAVDQATKGNTKSLNKKVENKVKNFLWNKLTK